MSYRNILLLLLWGVLLAACRPVAPAPDATATLIQPAGEATAAVELTLSSPTTAATAEVVATATAAATATRQPTQVPPATATVAATATRPAGDTVPLPVSGTPLRIQFPPGATSDTVSGTLAAGQKQGYLFRAAAGQLATVRLSSAGDRASFVVTGVGDGLFHKAPNDPARTWTAELPLTQDYLLVIAATADTSYTLELTVEALPSDLPPPRPTITTLGEAPVRVGPGLEFDTVHALPAGVSADILGRTADNEWLAISSPAPEQLAQVWIAAGDVQVQGDLALLVPILAGDD